MRPRRWVVADLEGQIRFPFRGYGGSSEEARRVFVISGGPGDRRGVVLANDPLKWIAGLSCSSKGGCSVGGSLRTPYS
jgi:hypothetical protein